MAEIFIRQLIDDLDGKPIDAGLRHEVTFSCQGVGYRIDLRPANADKIEAVFART
ncbi:Lsr2 dimerization domain-containing protein [Rhodococcus qingshengii]|uniref:Lsr2 dimerization domain-containing protein n=1 Tax=Rhodococcus qingshengii TaxID=334542 RepID=UPI003ECC00D8